MSQGYYMAPEPLSVVVPQTTATQTNTATQINTATQTSLNALVGGLRSPESFRPDTEAVQAAFGNGGQGRDKSLNAGLPNTQGSHQKSAPPPCVIEPRCAVKFAEQLVSLKDPAPTPLQVALARQLREYSQDSKKTPKFFDNLMQLTSDTLSKDGSGSITSEVRFTHDPKDGKMVISFSVSQGDKSYPIAVEVPKGEIPQGIGPALQKVTDAAKGNSLASLAPTSRATVAPSTGTIELAASPAFSSQPIGAFNGVSPALKLKETLNTQRSVAPPATSYLEGEHRFPSTSRQPQTPSTNAPQSLSPSPHNNSASTTPFSPTSLAPPSDRSSIPPRPLASSQLQVPQPQHGYVPPNQGAPNGITPSYVPPTTIPFQQPNQTFPTQQSTQREGWLNAVRLLVPYVENVIPKQLKGFLGPLLRNSFSPSKPMSTTTQFPLNRDTSPTNPFPGTIINPTFPPGMFDK
jgi:hypothetical protein